MILRDKTCLYCHTAFQTQDDRRKFCSFACSQDIRRGVTSLPIKQCQRCGVQFQAKKGRQKLCGSKCNLALSRERVRSFPTRECVFCSKLYTPTVKAQKLCSEACQKKYSARVFNAPPIRYRTEHIAQRHAQWLASSAQRAGRPGATPSPCASTAVQ